MPFSAFLNTYWNTWIFEFILLAVIGAIALLNWKRIAKVTMSNMILMAAIVWTAGVVLYSIGFAYEGSAGSFIAYFFRAAQASLEMFVSKNELIEVSHFYKENTTYMVLFSVVHILALGLSAILILDTLGFRITNYFTLLSERFLSNWKDKDTYIFWDVTEKSTCLAKDIRKNHEDARIIFIRPSADASLGEKLEVTQFTGQNKDTKSQTIIRAIESIQDSMASYCNVNVREVYNEILLSKNRKGALNVMDALHMQTLGHILRNTTNINFFVFTDDEDFNIEVGSLFYSDEAILRSEKKNVAIYTIAKYGGKNRILEEYLILNKTKGHYADWKIIDPSYLAVSSLKHNAAYHPVNCLPKRTNPDGTVSSPFTAIIIGFNRVGKEMANFMYEFSSFIKPDHNIIDRKIVIVDGNMDKETGDLCIDCPALFHNNEIEFIDKTPGTASFWREIRPFADVVNCVSISLGSDELNLNATIEIYRAILQYRQHTPKNLKIFIRIYDSKGEALILRMASSYNRFKEETGIEVIPFGSISSIFTEEVVLSRDTLKSAKAFNHKFDLAFGKNTDLTEDQAWISDYNIQSYIEKYKAAPLAIDEISKNITQCYAASLHAGSLLALIKSSPYKVDQLKEVIMSRANDSLTYTEATKAQQTLLDNLARNAYARFVSTYWAMGFRPLEGNISDPVEIARLRMSASMQSWDKAGMMQKLIAYTIVDTTIRLS